MGCEVDCMHRFVKRSRDSLARMSNNRQVTCICLRFAELGSISLLTCMQSINPFQNFGSGGGGAPQNPFTAAPTGAWGAPPPTYTLDTSYEPHGDGGYGGQTASSGGAFLLSMPSDATVPAVVPFTASTAAPVAMGTLGAPPSSAAAAAAGVCVCVCVPRCIPVTSMRMYMGTSMRMYMGTRYSALR